MRFSSLDAMLMYGGTSIDIFPRGPSISTVRGGSVRLTLRPCFDVSGSSMRNVTSGGSESGARPILEWHLEHVEKCEVLDVKAGTRKAGKVSSRAFGAARTDRKARDERVQRIDEAIVVDELRSRLIVVSNIRR